MATHRHQQITFCLSYFYKYFHLFYCVHFFLLLFVIFGLVFILSFQQYFNKNPDSVSLHIKLLQQISNKEVSCFNGYSNLYFCVLYIFKYPIILNIYKILQLILFLWAHAAYFIIYFKIILYLLYLKWKL